MPTDLSAKGLPETLKRSLKEHRQQVSAILKQLAMKDTYNKIKLAVDNKETGVREIYTTQDGVNMAKWGTLQFYEKVLFFYFVEKPFLSL